MHLGGQDIRIPTIRYNYFAIASVITRISLQRKAHSLRSLFAFVSIPSLRSLLFPMLRVGSVRSKRLIERKYEIPLMREAKAGNILLTYPEVVRDNPQSFTTFFLKGWISG